MREPPDSPGWRVRVVPNLYPAFERQEVVVHAPRHVRSFAELSDDECALVAAAWQSRRTADSGGYLHALINEGRAAGASLAHSHSQLVWLAQEPPGAVEDCLDEILAGEPIVERNGVVTACPRAGRVPYELIVAPRDAEADAWTSELLAPALSLVAEAMRRLHAVEGHVPLNAWLHTGRRWHIEVMPRLTVFAGIELGAGIYVNTLAPEEAARALREASA